MIVKRRHIGSRYNIHFRSSYGQTRSTAPSSRGRVLQVTDLCYPRLRNGTRRGLLQRYLTRSQGIVTPFQSLACRMREVLPLRDLLNDAYSRVAIRFVRTTCKTASQRAWVSGHRYVERCDWPSSCVDRHFRVALLLSTDGTNGLVRILQFGFQQSRVRVGDVSDHRRILLAKLHLAAEGA